MATESSFTPEQQDPRRRPARMALYAGVALIVLGGIVLYLGYNGTAHNPLVQAQIPYVVSGGLVGLGLLGLGGISIALYMLLQIQGDFRVELNALRDAIETLSDSLTKQGTATLTVAAPYTNGVVMVANGASSFHRQDCRLVARAEHVRPVPRTEAEGSGLTPCRICKP